jgi:thiamine pyrophosphokinase
VPFSLTAQVIGSDLGDAGRKRRALLVSGSPRGVPPAFGLRLAEAADFVVAVDSGAEMVRAAGVAPDLLLGDFDSIAADTLAGYRAAGVELSPHDAYKDATDIELALAELWRRGFAALLATNVLGGRIDHELASLGSLVAAAERGADVAVIEEGETCVFLSANGGRASLRLDFSDSVRPAFISLIPWGGATTVSINGVEWPLDHAVLASTSSRGVSNVLRDDCLAVEVHVGTAVVVFEFGAEDEIGAGAGAG